MSLDNVLLVASIARDNPALLFIGLTFSVLFMGLAANYVARLIQRYHWINYIGLAVILWVAWQHDLRRLGRRRACARPEERARAVSEANSAVPIATIDAAAIDIVDAT